ncbi:PREDICTED: N-acetylneuraminate lyase [Cyprinodon variegatus]|uniref:N-acetylneuraminate lyase n=1 Tax=Cyprinodon variegatus TaxID=28743 RepID=A0A3Q2EBP0_CYPVA|nr:PREDICTED: N-acetylneuraminate lyase [Cyprinodon variegatus]XP_015238119.1 PREDICTED: N-acetylneuraminate lyase [Cyprinodon variegatus]
MAPAADGKVTGLLAATFTPFTAQGEVNLSVIGPYVDYLKEKQGVKGIFVNGTTGESMSLSVAERKVLAEEWCLKAKGKMDSTIVHVGCMSLKDSQDLARHAAEIGADGIAVISPSFFKPKSAHALRRFLQEVALAAPNLPFYYYTIPAFTGVNVPVRDVIEDIEKLIPTFRGVKFSGSDLLDFGQCVSYSQPHWSVLYGVDEQLLAALAMGANGAVGSTYNYMGCYVNQLISAFETGDLVTARTIQFKIQELVGYAIKLGFDIGVNKQLMMEVSGLPLGPPRLPVMPCPPNHSKLIIQKYHSIFD